MIDHLNGIPAGAEYLGSGGPAGHVSAITRAEVLIGLESTDRQTTIRFLDCFVFISFNRDIADLTAELRYKHGWRLPDAFQAAVAQHHNLRLATRNTDDFKPKRYGFVLVPYTLRRQR